MSKLKGVGIGAGYFSDYHYEAWNRMDDVEIIAICDLDKVKAQKAANKWNVPAVYTDPEEMLQKVKPDFVDIITPPATHIQLVQAAADLGIPVICQKPLATTYEEALSIVEYVNKRQVRFMVHENFRFQPWYRQIKKMIDAGDIGKSLHTLYFRMRTGDGWAKDAYIDRQPYFRKMPKLLIYETGIHFIDTYRFLAGEVKSVYAQLRKLNKVIEGEDAGIVHYNFTSGAIGLYDGNRYNESTYSNNRYTFGEFIIEGSNGTLRLDGKGNLTLQNLGKKIRPIDYKHEQRRFAGDCVYFTLKHFINGLLNDLPFETSGPDYLRNLVVQDAIYESAQMNMVVQVVYPDKNH